MTHRREHVPFDGTPPDVRDGDRVAIRDAGGTWHRTVARGPARYDDEHTIGRRTYLTVPVAWPSAPGSLEWVNWPAEDVRPVTGMFWDDLAEGLMDPEFRRAYADAAQEIAERDAAALARQAPARQEQT